MNLVTVKVGDVFISPESLTRLTNKLKSKYDITYTIEYEGRYAKYVEDGRGKLKLNIKTVAIFEKELEKNGVSIQDAKKIVEEIRLNGVKKQPFLAPALFEYRYAPGKQDINNLKQIEDMVKGIATTAKNKYNDEVDDIVKIHVPLKYTIYVKIGRASKQKVFIPDTT